MYIYVIFLKLLLKLKIDIVDIFLLLIKHLNVLILQLSKFFVKFLGLISAIRLSYSSNNVNISMVICIEIIILSQF
jgi:hypothetical protein